MMKSFTLLEMIFVITLLSFVSFLVIPNVLISKQKSYLLKAKSDVGLIRQAIGNDYHDNSIKHQTYEYIPQLDDALVNHSNALLFGGLSDRPLLDYPIISASISNPSSGQWIKIGQFSYQLFLNTDDNVVFYYDNKTGQFNCNYKQELCQKLHY